jgi:hypothetical protein
MTGNQIQDQRIASLAKLQAKVTPEEMEREEEVFERGIGDFIAGIILLVILALLLTGVVNLYF